MSVARWGYCLGSSCQHHVRRIPTVRDSHVCPDTGGHAPASTDQRILTVWDLLVSPDIRRHTPVSILSGESRQSGIFFFVLTWSQTSQHHVQRISTVRDPRVSPDMDTYQAASPSCPKDSNSPGSSFQSWHGHISQHYIYFWRFSTVQESSVSPDMDTHQT